MSRRDMFGHDPFRNYDQWKTASPYDYEEPDEPTQAEADANEIAETEYYEKAFHKNFYQAINPLLLNLYEAEGGDAFDDAIDALLSEYEKWSPESQS